MRTDRGPTSTPLEQAMKFARIDLTPAHRQPAALLVVIATLVSLLGSLVLDAALVAVASKLFPTLQDYGHFRFADYARLTIIGVIIACAAWPIVTRFSSAPRWLFYRLAILVTVFLWLPDVYILYKGQPARAVAVLMLMHVVIALVTYNAVVRIAATRPAQIGSVACVPPSATCSVHADPSQ